MGVHPIRRLLAAAAALLATASLAGCGLGTAGGFTPSGTVSGPLKNIHLDGLKIAVGSKNFTEQLILGKMAVILLESAGAKVSDFTDIPGSASARAAQLQGEVDMEWEYTGTAWIAYLGHENGIPDKHKQYVAVRREDLRKNNLVWLPPAPMNNTYGFATTAETARKLHISKLSQIKDLPVKERTFCVESEFKNRNDGFQPMLKAYGLEFGSSVPRGNVKTLDTGAIYAATDQGDCNFGEIFTTDGRIQALNLKVLEDDHHFFPNYSVCPVVRKPVLDAYPSLRKLFEPVASTLNNTTLRRLNAAVDVHGKKPADVAMAFLQQQGFVR
ncbi:MAG TPA: glycine betaine ABC transporter substrate-binding protein [Nocardioidaceae bacterium]|jgi:osmoprotectant transport system substrate-binding protein|nr:glycine betaine ABC transporter substrate-binding protein [Nocardioidaceae bacterium]